MKNALRYNARKAAGDTVVRLVDRRAKVHEPNDAGKGNERNQQRVLDQILTLLVTEK
jgi:hypothetical protein